MPDRDESKHRVFLAAMAEDTPGVEAVTIFDHQVLVVTVEGKDLRLSNEHGTTVVRLIGPALSMSAEEYAAWPWPWNRKDQDA